MGSFLAAVLMIVDADPVIAWPVVGGVLVGVLSFFLLGYTIFRRFTGFGPHVVKTTETFGYKDGEDNWVKTSESRETQTSRTFWDWLTILTISAVIAAGGIWFSQEQRDRELEVADQNTKDEALQAYLDQMTQMMLDSEAPIREWTP